MTKEVLGKGGWGEVKVGLFRGTRVAVKCLHQEIVSEYYLGLFSREMDIASHVRHPNLLQFIGAPKVGNPIIVTELMPTSLRNELQKSPMARPQFMSIGIDVASALNYLHLWKLQPILHRDVTVLTSSLSNLLDISRKLKSLIMDQPIYLTRFRQLVQAVQYIQLLRQQLLVFIHQLWMCTVLEFCWWKCLLDDFPLQKKLRKRHKSGK